MMDAEVLRGGFSDPVFQSQTVFRGILNAFSRPGTIVAIPDMVTAPAPLHGATATILCALADEGTAIYFDRPEDRSGRVAEWVSFQTGARIAERPDESQFAVIADPQAMLDFGAFSLGSQEYPDRSTTIIVQIEAYFGGATLRLEGPGIRRYVEVNPRPLPEDFAARMQANRARFPRGVDVVLAASQAILVLPRSVHVGR